MNCFVPRTQSVSVEESKKFNTWFVASVVAVEVGVSETCQEEAPVNGYRPTSLLVPLLYN